MEKIVSKNKRPFGFYVCSITFSFERAAYYAAKYMIYIFVAATVVTSGLGLTKEEGAILQSNLVAFTYLAPIFGGIISDRFLGARYCIPIGLLLMAGGYYIGSIATTGMHINLLVLLVAIGTGLFKGNNAAITGSLFDEEKQLDLAFSTQYSFVNISAFIGTTAIGILIATTFANGDIQGFRPSFKLISAICVIAAIWFVFGMRFLGEAGKRPFKEGKHSEKSEVKHADPLTKSDKKRVASIILISLFSVIFLVFWYLTYLAAYDYGAAFINMNLGNFNFPLSWFDSLNSLTCIILGPVLGMLWYRLSLRPKGDLSLFKKLALGLIFLGASFLMLVLAEINRGIGAPETAKASLMYLVFFGLFLSLGEMLFSPLGNSFVTKYAPPKLFAVLMGVWTFATFLQENPMAISMVLQPNSL